MRPSDFARTMFRDGKHLDQVAGVRSNPRIHFGDVAHAEFEWILRARDVAQRHVDRGETRGVSVAQNALLDFYRLRVGIRVVAVGIFQPAEGVDDEGAAWEGTAGWIRLGRVSGGGGVPARRRGEGCGGEGKKSAAMEGAHGCPGGIVLGARTPVNCRAMPCFRGFVRWCSLRLRSPFRSIYALRETYGLEASRRAFVPRNRRRLARDICHFGRALG